MSAEIKGEKTIFNKYGIKVKVEANIDLDNILDQSNTDWETFITILQLLGKIIKLEAT